jgi:hypothetical protein
MGPENSVVILVKAVSILDRQLGLANAAQSANSLGESGGVPLLELSVQLG